MSCLLVLLKLDPLPRDLVTLGLQFYVSKPAGCKRAQLCTSHPQQGVFTCEVCELIVQQMAGVWNQEETLRSIEIGGNYAIHAQLESCKHNQDAHRKIAVEVTRCGYERTVLQCRDKTSKCFRYTCTYI